MKILLGVLLIAHGLVHGILAVAPDPADSEARPGLFFTDINRSWLLSRIGLSPNLVKWFGISLVVLSTLGFLLAGLGFLGVPGLVAIWRGLATISSITSLLLLGAFWHPWLPVGVLLDLIFFVLIQVINWPPSGLFGN